MSKDILQFIPWNDEKALMDLCAAFGSLAAAYVKEYEGEDKKAALAEELLHLIFRKCLSCMAENKVVNVADIECCQDDCPLRKLGSDFAAGVMIITSGKEA